MDRLIEERIKDIMIVKNKIDILHILFDDIDWFYALGDIEKASVFVRLENVMKSLDSVQKQIVDLRYGLTNGTRLVFKDVGEIVRIEPKVVRNIYHDAIAKLRNSKILMMIRYGEIDFVALQALKDPEFKNVVPTFTSNDVEGRQNVYADIILEDLSLSTRTFHCLKRAKINTLNELIYFYETRGEDGFLKIKNFGGICLAEIRKIIAECTPSDQTSAQL